MTEKGILKRRVITPVLALAAALCLLAGCSDDSTTGVSTGVVTDPYPLAVGNWWDYELTQNILVKPKPDTIPDGKLSSTGLQKVSVTCTEAVTGDEAFGVRHFHVMGSIVHPDLADTTVEVHYLAQNDDRILLKARETAYNTGGFIPFGQGSRGKQAGTMMTEGGANRFISFSQLARILLSPLASIAPASGLDALLASDGLQNRENVLFYDYDYIFVYKELYKGKRWTSAEAGGVGGIETTQKVTNILPELGGFEGPIAEVEVSNTFIEYFTSEQLQIRYYYKPGVGIVQAEIYDPSMWVIINMGNGDLLDLGVGLWAVTKKLITYEVK
ncbi:MAG: hypothetical protein U9P14_02240 [Gemmatimonadota bacterium]|nr:hypothetical protein [Gemmatimonadota bacterium]